MPVTPTQTSPIVRAQAGDIGAFDELVDLYSARLYGFLYRLTGHREDAEDLVQEVFVRVVRTIDSYVDDGKFEAWLFRIATNLARDRIRRVRRAVVIPMSGGSRSAEEGGAEGAVFESEADDEPAVAERNLDRAEQVDRLQKAMTRLPEAEREVILLRHYTDLSFAQIADMMGTPLGTALARSHRGLQKMREMLKDDA